MTLSGTVFKKASNWAFVFHVPVGLLGLVTKIIFVLGVTAAAIATKSCPQFLAGTWMILPPTICVTKP